MSQTFGLLFPIQEKKIFPRKTFLYTDSGFHNGRTTTDDLSEANVNNINISYLHYHYRSKNKWLQSTEQKLKARLGSNWNNAEILKKYDGPSYHLAKAMVSYHETGRWCDLPQSKKMYFNFNN